MPRRNVRVHQVVVVEAVVHFRHHSTSDIFALPVIVRAGNVGQLLVLMPTSRISASGQEWRVIAQPVKIRRTHTGVRCGLGPEGHVKRGNHVSAHRACSDVGQA